jgi:hypothetical protein
MNAQSQKLTPWFSGGEKPVRSGPYERLYREEPEDTSFCFYCLETDKWLLGAASPSEAERWYDLYESSESISKLCISSHQNLSWRGILK